MAKRKLNLAKLVASLTAKQLEQLQHLAKENPRKQKLEARRNKLAAQLAAIDRQIAQATGEAPAKRRCRPPKAMAAPKVRRMRKGKRKTVTTAKVVRAKTKAKAKRTPEQQAAINARMAKARAARKINKVRAAN